MRLSLPHTLCLLLAGTTVWCNEDTCPDVKLVGIEGSDRLAILNGFPGVPGPPGLNGDAGPAGSKGDNGAPGFNGSTGPIGAKGEIGPIGPPGQKGSIGTSGLPGLPGLRGEKGERGFPGNTGTSGAKGDRGERGDSTQGYTASKNCMELLNNGAILTGWYTIYLEGKKPLNVLCDMDTDGGGWIVFQRRVDGSVDFYRDWKSYKQGFGSQLGEFWLGNENIHLLTATGDFQLRFDLEDFDNNRTYATYSKFRLEGESKKYTLRYGEFSGGTAGDSLNHHNDKAFTTKDADNDSADTNNCAVLYSGAWWYKSCHDSNLNGLYLRGNHTNKGSGMMWYKFGGSYYSLKVSEIKFRPQK